MHAPVVFAVDDRFSLGTAVAIRSIASSNRRQLSNLDVIVMHEGLREGSVRRLRFHADDAGIRLRLLRHQLPPHSYKVDRGASRANYLRLLVPDALAEHETALYLDSDTLILDDLVPLLGTDTGDLPLAAVRDPHNPLYGRGEALPCWKSLGISADREYFNSGVMLLDLRVCREERLFSRALRFLDERPECVRFWDQDALNWAVGDRWLRLDRAWNTAPFSAWAPLFRDRTEHLVPFETLIAEESSARIMHYVTRLKPWSRGFPAGAARDLYTKHLADLLDAETRGFR